MKLINCTTIFIMCFILIGEVKTQETGKYLQNQIQSSVKLKIGNFYGSGVIIQDSFSMYLITARHNLYDDSLKLKENIVSILFYSKNFTDDLSNYFEVDLNKLFIDGNLNFMNEIDVAVIKLGYFSKTSTKAKYAITYCTGIKRIGTRVDFAPIYFSFNNIISKKDLFLGDNVFIVGFPISLGLQNVPQFDYDRPLLKRCSIASLSNNYITFIIDCAVYGGNSGGAVYLERKSSSFYTIKLIGIISQYIPFYKETTLKKDYYDQTSSYAVVIPIEYALTLILNMEKNRFKKQH